MVSPLLAELKAEIVGVVGCCVFYFRRRWSLSFAPAKIDDEQWIAYFV